jgi:general stress protein 26
MEQTNLDIYGAEPIPWSRALDLLDHLQDDSTNKTIWLATVRPDGRPHLAGVGALWLDGTFYFVSGAGTRKSKNLAENPNCVLSVSLPDLDLVLEGTATQVTDDATLQRLAERYAASGWPAQVENGAFTAPYSAPSAGPPPWNLYVVTPSVVFGVGLGGAMRWRFES